MFSSIRKRRDWYLMSPSSAELVEPMLVVSSSCYLAKLLSEFAEDVDERVDLIIYFSEYKLKC